MLPAMLKFAKLIKVAKCIFMQGARNMRKVPINYLKPGMIVARTVFSADGYVLLNSGVRIKQRYITQLENFSIQAVYIEDLI